MSVLVFFIEQIAFGLYILLGVGLILAWRSMTRAQREYRGTYYELERDLARYRVANAATTIVLLAEAALVVLGVQSVVAPTIRATASDAPAIVPVIRDGVFITPTRFALENAPIDASGVILEEEDPAERVLVTPTLTPTPVGTIIPNAPAPVGCAADNPTGVALLQVPANGMVVFNPVSVVGVATSADFSFYRFEIRGPSTFENFAPLEDHQNQAEEMGELGRFVPAFYEPGEYRFRLTVFDITNTLRASCEVTIYISEPIPTPTPIGQGLSPGIAPVGTPIETPVPGG